MVARNACYSIAHVSILLIIPMLDAIEDNATWCLQVTKYKTTAEVVRNGGWVTLPSAQLVPGDVIRIPNNWLLPCDCIIIQGQAHGFRLPYVASYMHNMCFGGCPVYTRSPCLLMSIFLYAAVSCCVETAVWSACRQIWFDCPSGSALKRGPLILLAKSCQYSSIPKFGEAHRTLTVKDVLCEL